MEDLGAAVERIMADPAFSRMVKELGGGDGGNLMEKLPKVMETLGPMLGGSGGNGGEEAPASPDGSGMRREPSESQDAAEPGPPSPSMPPDGFLSRMGSRPYNRSDAEKLFLALKPYLGDRRRELADRCVSLMQMGELMKAAGLFSPHGAGGGRESHET